MTWRQFFTEAAPYALALFAALWFADCVASDISKAVAIEEERQLDEWSRGE